MRFHNFYLLIVVLITSCAEEQLPKPASYLRLEYPIAEYKELNKDLPYSFVCNKEVQIIKKSNKWIDLRYPEMKATLVLTYFPVKNNLKKMFVDAEKLTFKHVIKADDIQAMPFQNPEKKVYGKMFEVYGNAATQIQFHATDSISHFLTGALYFYAKPNYDSILPAVHYLRKDIVRLMETLEWNK